MLWTWVLFITFVGVHCELASIARSDDCDKMLSELSWVDVLLCDMCSVSSLTNHTVGSSGAAVLY